MLKQIDAGVLSVSYTDRGPSNGTPVVLLHGFPYDVHAYDEVAPLLASSGCRVLTPYLRGFGPTRFLHAETLRSGQQAALAHDLTAFMDALEIDSAVLAGYDWGGRAACVVAALWPERVRGLVSGGGYNIQDIAGSGRPQSPENEHRLWYQYYLHAERGRAGLAENRDEFCKLLWRLWSPAWNFDNRIYAQSAASFGNPDFVEVVVHSYRHRFALVPGDARYETTERQLAGQPQIRAATVVLDGASNGVLPAGASAGHAKFFAGPYERRVVASAGHNLPQEAPREFADAVMSLV